MTLEEALIEIRSFWPSDEALPFVGTTVDRLERLQQEFGEEFPDDLRQYLLLAAPRTRCAFEQIGNPVSLYGVEDLSPMIDGYSFNPNDGKPIDDWSRSWFLLGDEGADPRIVDLADATTPLPVLGAMHGQGAWDFGPVASSLAQYLLVVAGIHRALTMNFLHILDDENGFTLNEEAADWLFPRVRRWAPEYYDDWLSVFDNA